MKLDPTAARALTLMSQFQSTLQGRFHHMNNGVFKASDETKSVQVTLNGYRIENGLLKEVGAQGVAERVNEALQNAQRAVSVFDEQSGQTLVDTLATISAAISQPPA
ncbi:secretion protein EspL [Mycobacterium marinum]|uniref:secretion protein EspL n=1 Tax=Mycobacterium marinum TaxID=1781 RepID=UPI0035655D86